MTAREELHAAFVGAMQDGNWHMTADEDHAKATDMVDAAISEALHAAAERIRRAPHDGTGDTWGWWDAADIPDHCADLIDPDKQEQP